MQNCPQCNCFERDFVCCNNKMSLGGIYFKGDLNVLRMSKKKLNKVTTSIEKMKLL